MGKGIFLKRLSTWISVLIVSVCCSSLFAFANNTNEPYAETPYINPFIPQNPLLLHYSSDYLYADAQLSDLLGFSVNTKVTHRAGSHDAFALELDYGRNEDRIGFTWGHAFTRMHFLKFTAERLTQNLPFNFESGEVRVRVPQLAYGVTGAYLFRENLVKGVNFNLYYANATSQLFDEPQVLERDGSLFLDYRHIAGGRSYGASVGVDVMPWNTALIQLKLNYDQVQYTPLYQLVNADTSNNNLGFTAGINQLITPNLKINLLASCREIYNDYTAGVSWLPRLISNNLETNLTFEHIESNNSVTDENIIRFGVQVDLEGLLCSYTPPRCEYADLTTWTNTPAVHMARVLATADELLQQVQLLLTTINPSVGVAGAVVQIIGQGFTNDTTVLFGNRPATKVVLVNDKQLSVTVPANLPGPINVAVKNPSTAPVVLVGGFTYLTAGLSPDVEDILPNRGPQAGGTQITISGTGLRGVFEVDFGTHAATNLQVDSSGTELHCTLPPGTGTVDVRLLSTAGATVVPAVFTYDPRPTISGITPNHGVLNGGTTVTIIGTGFIDGLTTVNFGSAAATSVIVSSSTQLTCKTPPGLGRVNVAVTTPGGTSAKTDADNYTYAPIPTVTGVSPTFGPLSGGTSVIITGTNFNGVTAVKFGGNLGVITSKSDTSITATSPAGSGVVDVTVTTPGGTATSPNNFSYVTTPVITNVSPNIGVAAGGNPITLTGKGFTGTTQVKFGATPAAPFTVVSDTKITCTCPAGSGTVDIRVTNPVATSAITFADQYTFAAVPVITSVAPNLGPLSGGQTVVINGTALTGTTQVDFGAISTTAVVVNSDTQITCKTPVSPNVGTVNVTVHAAGGNVTSPNSYTYAPVPTISSFGVTSGPAAGGTSVTINGTGFLAGGGVSQVLFGSASATSVVVNSDTSVTVTSPPGVPASSVHITVTTNGGSAVSSGVYNYN